MSALRSLAFGASFLVATLLLLFTNLGVWTYATLLDPPSLARTAAEVLGRPEVRGHVSVQVAARLAPAVLELGPLPGPVRRLLGLSASPSEEALAAALAERIDGLLADPAAGDALMLATSAISGGVVAAIEAQRAGGADPTTEGLLVDLTPLARLVLDRLDDSGRLGGGIGPGAATIQLVDAQAMTWLLPIVRRLDALRTLLPAACLVAIVALLVVARFRVHALAWLGLGAVVAGTLSLLAATGAPVVLPRWLGTDGSATIAVTEALDGLTASLVTQSAVLAGLGLALVVAGICGGIVVSQGAARSDPQYGWDSGRLS